MTQQPIGNPEAPYPAAEAVAVGDIYHLPSGIKVTQDQLDSVVADARIVYVGETHDNPAAHRVQLQVLKAVVARHPGQVSLGMEMFNPGQQAVLDRWVAGELDEKTFLKEVNWFSSWKMDFAYYAEILHYAREAKIPVIGLNAPRDLVKAVGMTPFAELDEATRAQLPTIDMNDPYQKAMTETIYAGHGQSKNMLDGFLRVQTLWDEAMAESIVRHLDEKGPDRRMVVLAGGNHVRFGFGIPRRVYRRLPTSYLLVGSRELVVPEEKQDRMMDVTLPKFPMPPYDYVVYTAYESLPGERVKLGVRMTDTEGKVVVEAVVPNSTADQAGLLKGDVILVLNGIEIRENFDLVYEVNRHVRGDRAKIIIERDGRQMELDLTFQPLPAEGMHRP